VRFDFDVLEMLPTGTPAFDDFKRFVAEFGELDELVILLEAPDPAALRSFADRFGEKLGALDEVERVHVKTDPQAIGAGILGRHAHNYLPEEAFARLERLMQPGALDALMQANREALKAPLDLATARLLQRDPLGILRSTAASIRSALGPTSLSLTDAYVTAADGTAVLIFVRPTESAFDTIFTTRLMEHVRRAEAAAREEVGASRVSVGYTGSYAFALEDAATIRWDVKSYVVLALAAVLAVFSVGYRSLKIVPFVTYPLLLVGLLTFALSLLLFAQLNAVSISFAAILYGLSIDSGIHYYTRLLEECRHGSRRDVVTRTLRALGGANVVASTTTAAVFAIIGMSVVTGVRQLGLLTALGMLINIAVFFVIYPALSFLMPGVGVAGGTLETPRLGRLGSLCQRRARSVVVFAAALALVALYGATTARIDAGLLGLRPPDTEARRVEERIAELFDAKSEGGAVLGSGPQLEALLQQGEGVAARLMSYQKEGLVEAYRSISTLLPSAATQHRRLERFQRLPREAIVRSTREAMARHGFVADRFADFFQTFQKQDDAIVTLDSEALRPFRLVLERYVQTTPQGLTVATYVDPATGVSLEEIGRRLRQDLPAEQFIVAGRTRLEAELGRVLKNELQTFLLLAFAANFLLILLNVRRLWPTLAILVPQAVVLLLCFSSMSLLGIAIGPVNLIVFPLILGIGVDDCVYLSERHQQGEPVGVALQRGGRALVITSLTTVAGFGFLGLSEYPALSQMGMLAAVGLLLSLLAALTLLPALLALAKSPASAGRES
jgi:predicted RND superfamily exporter protein